MADVEAAEDSSLPWKSMGKSSKRSSNPNIKCVCAFLISHYLYMDISVKWSQYQTHQTSLMSLSHPLFFSAGHLQYSNSQQGTQPKLQADGLVRKRNNVWKWSEITNFCPFVCLWFIFVTCYSASPAQRKTAPHAQRCENPLVQNSVFCWLTR